MLYRMPTTRLYFLLAGASVLMTSAACTPVVNSQSAASLKPEEEVDEIPDGTPEELASMLETAADKAESISELLGSGVNRRQRRIGLEREITRGIRVADKLVAHQDVNPEQRKKTHTDKLALLYRGTQHDREKFEQQLKDFIEQLKADDPQGEPAAFGAAIWLEWKYLKTNQPIEKVLPALTEYAETYPESLAGIGLFRQYAEIRRKADDDVGAIECCQTAVKLYGNHPAVQILHNQLNQYRQVALNRIQKQRAKQARIAAIKSKLGGRTNGLFLIYSYEVTDKNLYRFEYSVVRGVDSAVSLVSSLRKTWTWELVQWFPDTPARQQQAHKMRKELTKKRTFTTTPVFN